MKHNLRISYGFMIYIFIILSISFPPFIDSFGEKKTNPIYDENYNPISRNSFFLFLL